MLNEPSNRSGSLGRLNVSDDPSWVQPPDAENRMSGGVEGLRGEIPVSPSDPKQKNKTRLLRIKNHTREPPRPPENQTLKNDISFCDLKPLIWG